MTALTVGPPCLERSGTSLRYSSRIRSPNGEFELWFRGPAAAMFPRGADALLAVCLTTAMKQGLPLVVEGGVSPRLLAAAATIQDIFHCWDASLRKVPLEAEARHAEPGSARSGTASFFSGGVDSFYTAFKHRAAIDALVLVHGFDIPLANTALRAKAAHNVGLAAQALGKPLVEIETNCRELTDRHVDWTYHQFGPALAAVALLLGGVAGRVLVPASESYAHLDPCGSHPLLDPLWSSEEIEIRLDGAEASRNDKVALIAQHPEVLPLLRVCWENRGDSYNCGRCEKCIRTMIHLEIAGVLDRCGAFEAPLDAETVARMPIPNDLVCYHVEENLRLLRENGRDARLIAALEKSIDCYRAAGFARSLLDFGPRKLPLLSRSLAAELLMRLKRKVSRRVRARRPN